MHNRRRTTLVELSIQQPSQPTFYISEVTPEPPDAMVWEAAYRLFEIVPDEIYAAPIPPLTDFGIGSHIRHCIEFYQCFFAGLPDGTVDYDRRERNPKIAVERRAALLVMRGLTEQLRDFDSDDRGLSVFAESEGRGTQERPQASSVERERTFLLSHTIHHFAIVGLLLKLQGIEPPADFGVAPSTLAYWRRTGQCVR
jgi:hypothetical protein